MTPQEQARYDAVKRERDMYREKLTLVEAKRENLRRAYVQRTWDEYDAQQAIRAAAE